MKPCYIVSSTDRAKNIIFVESRQPSQEADLSRVFREVESQQYNPNRNGPWRVIYKTNFGVEHEVKLAHTWPRSYENWDRRYNPEVTTEKWHGHVWDALK